MEKIWGKTWMVMDAQKNKKAKREKLNDLTKKEKQHSFNSTDNLKEACWLWQRDLVEEVCTQLSAVALVQYMMTVFLVITFVTSNITIQTDKYLTQLLTKVNCYLLRTMLKTQVDTLTNCCTLPDITFKSQPSVVDRPCDTPAAITAPEWIIGPSYQTPTLAVNHRTILKLLTSHHQHNHISIYTPWAIKNVPLLFFW